MSPAAHLQRRLSPDPAVSPETAADDVALDRRGPFRPKRLVPTRARLQGRVVVATFQGLDALAVALLAAALIFLGHGPAPALVAAAAGVVGCLGQFKVYRFGRYETLPLHFLRLAVAFCVGVAIGFLALAPFDPLPSLARAFAIWAPACAAALTVLHLVWMLSVRHWRANGRLTPNIVIVGATASADRLIAHALTTRRANILGVFDDRLARTPGAVRGVRVLGDTRQLLDHRIMPYVDRIVITVPPRARVRVGQLIERLRVLPNEITLLLEGGDAARENAAFSRLIDVPLAYISGPPTNHARAFLKRGQDLVIGLAALVVAIPIMAVIAVAVRLDSPGPILFRQRRHGFNNEEIVVWKFRSMRQETADYTAARQVKVGDDRVTRVGRFIRRTSLDELPQIFNVLKGEMSLVGPRPHAIGMKTGDTESARLVAEYAHRHRMKPGITGWAAIHGSRGPVDTPEAVRRRVVLDVAYIERQSFWLDLYVLAMTLPCLLGDRATVR